MTARSAASSWFDWLVFDLRLALRGLWRDRSFTLTAVVTLALAIALNVTVFVVMSAVLLRGFPLVEDNDRLLYVQERFPLGQCCISYPDVAVWRAEAASFESLAFVRGQRVAFSPNPGERSVDLSARAITANGFSVLRVRPQLGRDFVAADETPGAPPVVILSHAFWQSRFGTRADIVGHPVELDGALATVVGVMPEGFHFPEREGMWVPLVRAPELLADRTPRGYLAFGRLTESATAESARAELETINRRLAADYPATNRDVVPRVSTFAEFFVGPDAAAIYWSLWAAGCFVLLIACANLANLALARVLGKSQELSTRIALGSGRRRLVQQILCEWLVLAATGGALAWPIASASIRTWAVATESQYQILDYTVNGGTLVYLVAVTLGAAVLIGLAPIARVLHLDFRGAFRGAARGATQGRRARHASKLLVASQMTLAIVLLCGAGVLGLSFWNVVSADAGVDAPENVLIGLVTPPRDEYPTADSRVAFYDSLRAQLLEVPGVERASLSSSRPVNNMRVVPFDAETGSGSTIGAQSVSVLTTGTDYFRTVGAATLTGREFDDRDGIGSALVAVVNDSFVARHLPNQNPIGLRVRLYDGAEAGEWRTIVGVVSNIMQSDPTRQRFLPLVYLPFRQAPPPNAWFFARTQAPTDAVLAQVRAEVLRLDPDVALEELETLAASFRFIAARMDLEHVNMGKLAAVAPIFAGVALALAAIGLYAVLARSVGQRRREIGIRMAIGATRRNIRRLVLREELLPVLLGLGFGLAASLAVNRVLQSQLVGVSPYDPVTLAATPILLLGVALLACHWPASRAMRVDPSVALRDE